MHCVDSPMRGIDMADRLLNVQEIAAKAQVGKRTGYKIVSSPGFPAARRLSTSIRRWLESEVDAYFAALPPALDCVEPAKLSRGRTAFLALPAEEREARRAARKAEREARARHADDGSTGGTLTPDLAEPRQSRVLAEGLSVEPEKGVA